jgi:hypothetical protein
MNLGRLLCATVLVAGIASAQEQPAEQPLKQVEPEPPRERTKESAQQPAPNKAQTAALPVYKPPPRGAPRARVGGGARGSKELPGPLALAPEHVAYTISPSPSLFWYIESVPPASAQLVFTLNDAGRTEPIAEIELPRPAAPGIQRIDLSDYDLELEPGIEYEWSIALVREPDVRSRDLLGMAYVQRVPTPANLDETSVQSLAELGLWYDALSLASKALGPGPTHSPACEARDSLLRQAGLDSATRPEGCRGSP